MLPLVLYKTGGEGTVILQSLHQDVPISVHLQWETVVL